jgi:hypothetical protein
MTRRYSTTSVETTLSGAISNSTETITVANSLNLIPAAVGFVNNADQFAIVIDPDTASEEVCFVRSVDNITKQLTVTRGQADTTAITHASGATVKHVLTGEDMKNIITQTDNSVKKTDIAAKGDLYAGTANDTVSILTVGADERRLVADSAQATGLKYVADTTNYAVAAKGDLLAGTAADTVQAVTVGSNGSTLFANSTATPGVTWSGAQVGKNLLINGDLNVNQRAVSSLTLSTSTQWLADRFFSKRSGSGGFVISSLSATGGPTGIPAYGQMLRASSTTATDTIYLGQTVETLNAKQLQGQTVTFSFYARKGAGYTGASDALQVRVYTGTGTDETGLGSAYTGTATPISSNATLTTSWQRFSFTAAISSTATQLQAVVQYVPVGTAPGNDYFHATGFQLEVGSVATPFALAGGGTFGAELNLCRRYYERWTSDSSYMRFGMGIASSATQARVAIMYKVPKRTASINSDNNGTGLLAAGGNYNLSSYSIFNADKDTCTFNYNVSGSSFGTREIVEFGANNTVGAYQGWDAEIY